MPLLSIRKNLWKCNFLTNCTKFCVNLLVYFSKKVVLKASSYSNPMSHFKHLQWRCFWGNFKICRRVLLLDCYFWNWPSISWIFFIKMCCLYYIKRAINVLTDSFLLSTNILFKMLKFNTLYYKKKLYGKISFNLFLLQIYNSLFFVSEVLYESSRTPVKALLLLVENTESSINPRNTKLPPNKSYSRDISITWH